jgi:hypothetical protein
MEILKGCVESNNPQVYPNERKKNMSTTKTRYMTQLLIRCHVGYCVGTCNNCVDSMSYWLWWLGFAVYVWYLWYVLYHFSFVYMSYNLLNRTFFFHHSIYCCRCFILWTQSCHIYIYVYIHCCRCESCAMLCLLCFVHWLTCIFYFICYVFLFFLLPFFFFYIFLLGF